MDLGTLRAKGTMIALTYDGQQLNIEFKPHLITPAYRAEFRQKVKALDEAGTTGDALFAETVVQSVADVLTRWDITLDGAEYPVSRENVAGLPEGLVAMIWNAIDSFLGKLMSGEPNG